MLRKSSRKSRRSDSSFGTKLQYEPLEPRLVMAAEDLIDFTAMPSGALDGKIVYTGAGHGWEYLNGNLTTNRGDVNEIVEPFGNQDQMTYFADYLLRAVPLWRLCDLSVTSLTKLCSTMIPSE